MDFDTPNARNASGRGGRTAAFKFYEIPGNLYASANGANGPVICTLLTLLADPATVASFSDNKKDDNRPDRWRYADLYTAISPARQDLFAEVGITSRSAYSWLCRRRHNHVLRHSFASLLLHEGRSVIYVARQLGHGAQLTMGTYGHVIDELEATPRLGAEDAIRAARGLSRTGTSDP